MNYELRPIGPEEFEAFARADGTAFGFVPDAKQLEQTRQFWEFDRSLAMFDGDEIVSTTGIFSFDMTVPGGSLPSAGVTWVSVKPTHRRRGLLTQMMHRQLSDIRDRGEAIAALWASESLIYERFGYGMAAENVNFTIDRMRTTMRHQPEAPGRLRLVTRDDALRDWPALYEKARLGRPGMYSRSDAWWQYKTLREPDRSSSGFSGRFYVQYEEDERILGYARYRIRGGNRDGSPDGTLAVQEVVALTDGAHAALWGYLFGSDLVSTIQAQHRPPDDPLLWMLADPRRLVRQPFDSLWVRIVDVPRALEGRRYSVQGRVVLDVRDAFCPWVEGRYELEATGEGARCRATDAEPDLTLGAAELGAAYLGWARFATMRRAGRVDGDEATVRRADAMFGWDPLPFCPEVF